MLAANRFHSGHYIIFANWFFGLSPFPKDIMLIYNMKLISKWILNDRKWVAFPMLRVKS